VDHIDEKLEEENQLGSSKNILLKDYNITQKEILKAKPNPKKHAGKGIN